MNSISKLIITLQSSLIEISEVCYMLISLHSLILEQRQKFLLGHSIAHYHRNLDYKLARRRNPYPFSTSLMFLILLSTRVLHRTVMQNLFSLQILYTISTFSLA